MCIFTYKHIYIYIYTHYFTYIVLKIPLFLTTNAMR